MPVRRIQQKQVPVNRFQNSPLYETPEWKDVVREIKKGLKPKEALEVVLSKDTIAKVPLKDPIRAFAVALRRYIKKFDLPVDTTTRASEEGDGMVIYVEGRTDSRLT